LPSQLDDLVSAGLLEAVPIDPFCDQPLRYSPDRRIVWSVGPNAVDDGGQTADGCGGWMQKDLVWEIPE
jgi:hypothetical protein